MTFRSKIDRWLLALLTLAALSPLLIATAAIHRGEPWLPHVLAAALLAALFAWIVLSTKYTVQDRVVRVQSGPFRWVIEIQSIIKIEPTQSVMSSPALSMDRLRIEYGNGQKFLLVSPEDGAGFIKAIQSAKSAA